MAGEPRDSGAAFRDPTAEWLEADGLGGFASGTANLIRTRRYHALLLTALTPPTGRHAIVSDVEVWIELAGDRFDLCSHRYLGDVIHADGGSRLIGFDTDPWPAWTFELPNGVITREVFVPRGTAAVVQRWTLRGTGERRATLSVRPLLSCRDFHSLMHENGAFRFDAEVAGGRVAWRPYDGLPVVAAYANGTYEHGPDWYRNFMYTEERARGLDFTEDLASPGIVRFDLAEGAAVMVLAAERDGIDTSALDKLRVAAASDEPERRKNITAAVRTLATAEKRRRAKFSKRLERSADAYIVGRGAGLTIMAGYPWFNDWGRDTFIAMRGLCLATGRLSDAGAILAEWAGHVSEGMLPNRFADTGERTEYNAVDASLWYVIAVHEWLDLMEAATRRVAAKMLKRLRGACEAILEGYARGTRFGIRLDEDGLIAAGEPGVQLTWMDARVGDRVITPRIGKPVEIQALWLNALRMSRRFGDHWDERYVHGLASFRKRFWNETAGALYDVIDVEHRRGEFDGSIRPNMLFAVGGLPHAIIDGPRARRVVDVAEEKLWTPLGPRSLSPFDPRYVGNYQGGVAERDGAYHQGTVWPWLMGAFIDAWVRVRGGTAEVKQEAYERFVPQFLAHLDVAGLGHVSEIADGDPPHTPRGCPFQAWSVSELIRVTQVVLAERGPAASSKPPDPSAVLEIQHSRP
jgi:predicted glycogen debranching enzyme